MENYFNIIFRCHSRCHYLITPLFIITYNSDPFPYKQRVRGSNPWTPTKKPQNSLFWGFCRLNG